MIRVCPYVLRPSGAPRDRFVRYIKLRRYAFSGSIQSKGNSKTDFFQSGVGTAAATAGMNLLPTTDDVDAGAKVEAGTPDVVVVILILPTSHQSLTS